MSRFLRNTLKFSALVLGVLFVFCLLTIWRLNVNPPKPDFFTPYLQAGIESIFPHSRISLGSSSVVWDKEKWEFDVRVEAINVKDAAENEIADIPLLSARIGPLGFVIGNFMPKELMIDSPKIKLERTKDGHFIFGGIRVSENRQQEDSESLNEGLGKTLKQFSRAMLMRKMDIKNAIFLVHDEGKLTDWSLNVSEASLKRSVMRAVDGSLSIGPLVGHFTVQIPQKGDDAALDVVYAYNPLSEKHAFTATFNNVTPAFIAGGRPETVGLFAASMVEIPLTGKIKLHLDRKGTLLAAAAQIRGEGGRLIYPEFWDNPCGIKSFSLNVDYDLASRKLKVHETRIDFKGPTLDFDISGTPSQDRGKDFDIELKLILQNLPLNRYAEIWPKPILSNAREWISANLAKGAFSKAEATLRGSIAMADIGNMSIAEGGGTIALSGARVTYVAGLPPIENVNAEATYDLERMDIRVIAGGIGAIRLLPFTMRISGLSDVDQYIDIPLKIAGPLSDVLSLLDHPPLGYVKGLGIAPKELDGRIEGTVNFRFPLLKALAVKDIDVGAEATTNGLASSALIPGVPIDQGNLSLSLTAKGFDLKGPIAFGKAPFHVEWRENFQETAEAPVRHISLSGSIKDDQWSNLGTSLFNGTKGVVKVSLDLTKPTKEKTAVMGAIDMTSAEMAVARLGWHKPADAKALFSFSATAVNGQNVDIPQIELQGAKESIKGSATLSPEMTQMLSLDLSPVIVGRTNANIRYSQKADGSVFYDIKGKSLDISGLQGGKEGQSAKPHSEEFHIQVDTLYAKGEDGFIEKASGFAIRDSGGWKQILLRGLAGGDTPISVELASQRNGARVFKATCDNLGKALRGLGYGNTLKNGKLHIHGRSAVENPRLIVGKAVLKDFFVEDLPILARLMNATSPFGFADLITDKTNFSRFEGDFKWRGDEITIVRAHASGSAVGINVEGVIDLLSKSANLQGTVVPFSVMNSILNVIPLVGGLITGGENQGVLAVSYKIEGSLNSPQISVNPVSLLTPGFLRNVFFNEDIGEDQNQEIKSDR